MKISMGDKKSVEEIGTIESHFGFPFEVQPDHTLVCEVVGKMAAVASQEIKNGRVKIWYPPHTDAQPEEEKETVIDKKHIPIPDDADKKDDKKTKKDK